MKTKLRNYKLCNLKPAISNSDDGMVLIVALLLLLVATVVGVTALSTSTTNVMIAGNQRLNEINFTAADSGISVSIPIIETTVFDGSVSSSYSGIVPDANFADELSSSPPDPDSALIAPDIQYPLGSGSTVTTVSIDVDRLYSSATTGGAILMFMGYEGAGTGAGTGGVVIYYSIDSFAEGSVGSQTAVCGLYKYVTK